MTLLPEAQGTGKAAHRQQLRADYNIGKMGSGCLSHVTTLMTCLVALLLCLAVTSAQAKSVPDTCKYCNAVSVPKSLRMVRICTQCGEFFGYKYENCCFCDVMTFEGCEIAVERYSKSRK